MLWVWAAFRREEATRDGETRDVEARGLLDISYGEITVSELEIALDLARGAVIDYRACLTS